MELKNVVHDQHYLPQMYLRFFTHDINKTFVWTMNSFLSIKSRSTSEICWKKDLYELQGTNDVNEIENLYASYENFFAPRLKWIIYEILNYQKLTQDNIVVLYAFFQMLFFRHQYILQYGSEILIDMNLTKNINIARDAVRTIGSFNLPELTEQFRKTHDLKIGINKTIVPFITSDFPFCIKPHETAFNKQMFYFPLTPEIILLFIPKNNSKDFNDFNMFDENLVDLFNHFICERRFNRDFLLISNKKDVLTAYKLSDLFKKDYDTLIKTLKQNKSSL